MGNLDVEVPRPHTHQELRPSMVVTSERIAANRKNSEKSSGPKTDQGKAISRANGLKHGMTGEGIVIPQEDVAEVDRRTAAFQLDLKPQTEHGVILTRRMAIHSVRMERCVVEETAALGFRVREAQAAVDALGIADPVQAALARQDAADLAGFDPSKEAQLARRYEAASENAYYKAVKEFNRVEGPVKANAKPEPKKTSVEVGSSLQDEFAAYEKLQEEFFRTLPPFQATPTAAPNEPDWMPKSSSYPKLPNDLADFRIIPPG